MIPINIVFSSITLLFIYVGHLPMFFPDAPITVTYTGIKKDIILHNFCIEFLLHFWTASSQCERLVAGRRTWWTGVSVTAV